MSRQVLFIRNDPTAPAAMLGDTFAELGFDITVFNVTADACGAKPIVDLEFPDPSRYDVVVPLGARWAVYDEELLQSWVGTEIAFIQKAVEAGVGVLGVCFGGQLIASALGGSVQRSQAPEIGWCDIPSNNPDLVPHGPWFQWHFDRWNLPPGATEIARNSSASQAFVQGTALALQFHPELDNRVLETWITEDHDGDAADLGLTAEDLRARTTVELGAAARRVRQLVRGFLNNVADAGRSGSR